MADANRKKTDDEGKCLRCGRIHPRCTAHKRDGTPCGQHAVKGVSVCKMHGGLAPWSRAKSARVAAEEEARKEMEKAMALTTLGIEMDISPSEALLQEVRFTAGHVHWLRGKVRALELAADKDLNQHPLVWGVTETKEISASQYPGTDETLAAGENVWYTLYMNERKHLVAVSAAAIKAGVEERRVRLAEQQGDLVGVAIEKILDALDLTPRQMAKAPEVVAASLRLVAGGAA